ncbi:hypothetical protein D9M68_833710 [compost metagenome]
MGGRPTARENRSKKVERDSAASLASASTVHARAGAACIKRKPTAIRASASPRSRPGGALSSVVERSASISSSSTSRASTSSRPGRVSSDSSRTSFTRTGRRSMPHTCSSDGSSETSNVESGESNSK